MFSNSPSSLTLTSKYTLPLAMLFAFSLFAQISQILMASEPAKPNFVIIFIDDMGYGDIGPFGSTINDTPHLDRMADEGMKLTSFYVADSVCTPSRAALMTGCYPKRVGMDYGSNFGVLLSKDSHGLNPDEITVAEVLKAQGYATGCFGKWHLGDQPEFMPNNQGFDEYFGIPYSNDIWPLHPRAMKFNPTFCPLPLLENEKVIEVVEDMEKQIPLAKRFTNAATAFIRKNKDKPFFVYLPHASIHHPRIAPSEFMDKAGDAKLANMDLPRMAHDYKYHMRQRTKAVIEEIDWSVGQVLGALRELKLDKNTLVLFTSDNGGSSGTVNKPLRGGKGTSFEGGMREPTVVWWPGKIPAGSESEEILTSMDLLPTFATLSGGKIPDDRIIDGKNISPILLGEEGAKSPHAYFYYHKRRSLDAVRSGDWKLFTNGQLYNLKKDIGEKNNVARDNPEVVKKLRGYLEAHKKDLGDPKNCRPAGVNPNPKWLVPFDPPKVVASEAKPKKRGKIKKK